MANARTERNADMRFMTVPPAADPASVHLTGAYLEPRDRCPPPKARLDSPCPPPYPLPASLATRPSVRATRMPGRDV